MDRTQIDKETGYNETRQYLVRATVNNVERFAARSDKKKGARKPHPKKRRCIYFSPLMIDNMRKSWKHATRKVEV